MFNSKLLNTLQSQGVFDDYQNHILSFALKGQKPSEHDFPEGSNNQYFKFVIEYYDTFVEGFERNIESYNKLFGFDCTKELISNYLSCNDFNEFSFRYSNVISLINIQYDGSSSLSASFEIDNDNLHFFYVYAKGKKEFNIIFGKVNKDPYITELKSKKNNVAIPANLNDVHKNELRTRLESMGYSFLDNQYNEYIDILNCIPKKIINDTKLINILIMQLVSECYENYNIKNEGAIFGHAKTGILKNRNILKVLNVKPSVYDLLSCVYLFKKPYTLIPCGEFRAVFDSKDYQFVTKNESPVADVFSKFSESTYNNVTIYSGSVNKDVQMEINSVATEVSEKFVHQIGVYTDSDIQSVRSFIGTILHKHPEFYKSFSLDYEECVEGILDGYKNVFNRIKNNYPENHPLYKASFLDAMYFTLAYSYYVVPKFMNCSAFIDDLLQRKLASYDGENCDIKRFNENYSEFGVFLYIFLGLIQNGNIKDVVSLEYEPDGAHGKRFEYSFCFKDGTKLNIEVKSIDCDPFIHDGVNSHEMENGQLFYKKYFKYDNELSIPEDIVSNGIELKSNFSQVAGNINNISKKCEVSPNNVNLGFLMINYGTSREEYISYLLNSKYGYLTHNPLNTIDAIVLFSFYSITDLFMNNILKELHLFVFPKNRANTEDLFNKIRLTNYAEDCLYKGNKNIAEDRYGVYRGFKNEHGITIQCDEPGVADKFEEIGKDLSDFNEHAIKF